MTIEYAHVPYLADYCEESRSSKLRMRIRVRSQMVRHACRDSPIRKRNSTTIKFTMANRLSSYKVEFMVQAVDWLRSHGRNVSAAARESGVDRKRIREWDKQYTRLLQYTGGAKKRRKIHPGRPPVSPELNQAVFNFLEEERSEGRVVTNKMLLRRAREIAEDEEDTEDAEDPIDSDVDDLDPFDDIED